MSCGCGGLPPSMAARLEIARLIAGSTTNDMIERGNLLWGFVSNGKSDAEIDAAAAKRASGGTSATSRNAVLTQLPSSLNLPIDIQGALAAKGIRSIGTMVQWHPHQYRDHAGLSPADIETIGKALEGLGLRLGMDSDQIRNWILHGSLRDPALSAQEA